MINKTGITNSNKGASSKNPSPLNIQNQIDGLKTNIISARVTDIVLNENHPLFDKVGNENGLGAIKFEFVNSTGTTNTSETNPVFALPLLPNLKVYPLINEIVTLIKLPNQQTGELNASLSYYYFPPLNLWNHPHHNAYPNPLTTTLLPQSQQQDYQQTEIGSVRRIEDGSTEINLGSVVNPTQNTFVERSNIHPLMPFDGDSLYEGRFGNSLRFSSTSKTNSKYKNNWSEEGNNGDPITILRNGQPKNSIDEGWIPTTENLNQDLSSIYLTSYQKIPFSIANENFVSYTNKPTLPSSYTNSQIIINSNRVILNAKSDSVLISGQISVGISSNDSVNIESKQIHIEGNDIKLGSSDPSKVQSVLRGDDTVDYLKIILTELQNIAEALKSIQDWPGGVPVPNPTILATAVSSGNILSQVSNNIDKIKSNFVKTI